MKINMSGVCETTMSKNLIPGQSFIYKNDMCIVVNRTRDGYLARKLCDDTGFEIRKDLVVRIVKSLKMV